MLNHINLLNLEGFRLSTDIEWWNKRGVFEASHVDDYVQVLIKMDQCGIDHEDIKMLQVLI